MMTTFNFPQNGSFLTDTSFEVLGIFYVSIHSNGTSIDEEEDEKCNALRYFLISLSRNMTETIRRSKSLEMAVEIVNETDPDDEKLLTVKETGFECELATNQSTHSHDDHLVTVKTNSSFEKIDKNDGGVLLVTEMHDDRTDVKDATNSISLVSFMFAVNDVKSLNAHIENRSERLRQWQDKIKENKIKLLEELAVHDDIVTVDVTDVYRNLPHKLLHCYQWISDHLHVKYVLKTDDDCFLDLENILNSLKKIENKTKVWWGSFRDDWLVERHGKWKERYFASSVFSKFSCGSGSIISQDIHCWLVANADYLHAFEGEDVAMGIWLAAINPSYIQDNNWKCEKICDTGLYSLPELTPEEMRHHWKKKITCNDPCKEC